MDYEQKIAQLEAKNALFKARCEQYAQAYEYLKEQIIAMRRQLFGKRSERDIDPEHKQQSLLDDPNAIFAAAEAAGEKLAETTAQVAAYTRAKKTQNTSKDLPRRIEIIPLADADKQCACGHVSLSFAMKPRN